MARVFNFSAGPATLPLPALERAQKDMLDFNGCGASIMELSHRGKEYEGVHNEAISLIKELLKVPANYKVLFFQGGATLQFTQVPLNYLKTSADYILTGTWAEKAYKSAKAQGSVKAAGSSKEQNYNFIPKGAQLKFDSKADYVHLCSNNTIYGTQYPSFPDVGNVPLFADMSSDFMSRPVDVSKFALIYAGAQKNIGPAGVTAVIVRDDILEKCSTSEKIPDIMNYKKMAEENSLINTPPCLAIYMVRNVLAWLKDIGGIPAIEKHNQKKAKLIYDAIDNSNGFYKGHAVKEDRSLMNITFRLKTPELEEEFAKTTSKMGMIGLKGHRSVGGIRASCYNAMSMEGCQALANFMKDFMAKKG